MKQFILMADVISSGKKDQNQLMIAFKELVHDINQSYKNDILSPLTITLGDEFQGILKDLATSVKIILSLEENIIHKKLNFQLRYILYQGEIETPINTDIAYEMLGSGLTNARAKLTNLKTDKSKFGVSIENKLQNDILNNAFIVFENITQKWDMESDYELVSNFIILDDYKIVAEKLDKTRSQIWKRKKTLNIESYNATKKIMQLITEK
ncbi:SatD family protein [Flavobacterium sp. Fl-77]|uniref:SatD family protein n=1 Tax=Flavobacterium flavipigmentatum TaxID=2893884 RepID=A0AAJ2S9V6_9FLAO|nr:MULTISPECIES: SatD family protein [unclassified Flavobacterium]MDX6181817.1 SatD family protein [Flavobacterium sp. Fl-33]MDX6185149.1 SatD family protein [Flavobacterium sp. Fl-77]UFH37256.1 SatD family protein [Flavobacterium sp. F-70]